MRQLIYTDPTITITKDFLIFPQGDREAIPIVSVSEVTVERKVTGDYKSGAVLFFILGILSIWFFVGFIFIALGLAAWNTRIYEYGLVVISNGKIVYARSGKRAGPLKDIARTIHGLSFSKKILELRPNIIL